MAFISVTFPVLSFDRSSDVRDKQPSNMLFIFVTFAVLNFDRSSDVREGQSLNI